MNDSICWLYYKEDINEYMHYEVITEWAHEEYTGRMLLLRIDYDGRLLIKFI